MRTIPHYSLVLRCLAVIAAFAWCSHALAGGSTPTAKQSANAVVLVPKSVFIDEPEKGKDPFFPSSNRRLMVLPRMTANTNSVSESHALFNLLQLKGLSGTRDERLAIINNTTIAEGEAADVRCENRQTLKVRCREIRDDSVLVEIEGVSEPRELKLRNNI